MPTIKPPKITQKKPEGSKRNPPAKTLRNNPVAEPPHRENPQIASLKGRVGGLEKQFQELSSKLEHTEKIYERKAEKPTQEAYSNTMEIIKLVTALFGAVAAITSIFYVLGFIIVNLHLSSYGIRDFAFDRPNYISSGILFVFFHSISLGVPITFFSYLSQPLFLSRRQRDLNYYVLQFCKIFVICASIATVYFGSINLLDTFSGKISPLVITPIDWGFQLRIWEGPFRNYSLFLTGIGMASLYFITQMRTRTEEISETTRKRNYQIIPYGILASLFGIIFLLANWAVNIHPFLLPAFGGGKPAITRLIITDSEKTDMFTQIGIPVNGLVTDPVNLVDETSKSITIILPDGNAVRIDRSLITNILYMKSADSTSQTEPTITTMSTPSGLSP
jgi:preprotein translocase subunit Sss1